MERLHEALEGDAKDHGVLEAARSLIELHPLERGGFEIELVGDIAAMIRLAQLGGNTTPDSAAIPGGSGVVPDVFACSLKVVAGTRNHLDLLLNG